MPLVVPQCLCVPASNVNTAKCDVQKVLKLLLSCCTALQKYKKMGGGIVCFPHLWYNSYRFWKLMCLEEIVTWIMVSYDLRHCLNRYDSLKSALLVLLCSGHPFQILSLLWTSWLLSPASRCSFPILPGICMSKSRQPGCSRESLPFSFPSLVSNMANVKIALSCSLMTVAGLSDSVAGAGKGDVGSSFYLLLPKVCVGCAVRLDGESCLLN